MHILNKPSIIYFTANSAEVRAKEEVTLEWKVENARKVRLDGIEVESCGTQKFYINDSQTFELTASNWKGMETEYLIVKLFTPVVLEFEADSPTIKEGEEVRIDLKLKHTQFWKIVADYGLDLGTKKETIAEGKMEDLSEVSHDTISFLAKGACLLTLITKNGFETGIPETMRLYSRHLALELLTSQTVVKSGSSVRLTWKAQNANKIVLNPGNFDVTILAHFDFFAESDHDIQLELKAFGDFGQKIVDSKTLYLAKFNNITTSNNGDASNPIFYLNWSATGLQNLRLLPINMPVNENVMNFQISGSSSSVTYILAGETYNGEEVLETITLKPCSVNRFLLERGKVIIGTMATILWEAENSKKIQIKFSNSPGIIDIPITESKHHFQVFKGRDKVKLIVWGDVNVSEMEIPIPAFESPEIKNIKTPLLRLQLDINWVASPLASSSQKVNKLFFLTKNTVTSGRNFYYRVCNYLSIPSSWMLNKTKKLPGYKCKKSKHALDSDPVSNKLAKLPEIVFANIDENLKNEITNEH